MSSPLIIKAGPSALAHIKQHGLTADAVEVFVGASGGPKWFSLFGLDQYLCGEFFKDRQKPLQLLGSSAGAWRFACYGQNDPVAASKRFCDAYRFLCYPPHAKIAEVTAISATVMDAVFPTDEHVTQVVNNPVFQLNFVVARAKGISKFQPKAAQLGALTLAAAANLVHRRTLGFFYQRYLFQHQLAANAFAELIDLPTTRVELGQDNLKDALLATGAIPLVISPVTHIANAGSGIFVDGGIMDYHFDWPFSQKGLVLYPHFYTHLSPGWFDKNLKWRRGNKAHFHNLVLMCPSDSWVKSLPYGKIPDRTDFDKLSDAARISYWQQVTERSFELAEAFKNGNYQLEAL